MLIPLLAKRAKLSADKVSMVTMECWSLPDTAPLPASVPAAGEAASPANVELLVTVPTFLLKWVLMCFERWSLRMKRLGHSVQANLFSPGERVKEGKDEDISHLW